jgi:predicted ATPase
MLAKGWAAAEVGTRYKRARELARRLESPADLVPPLVGSWLYFQGSAQFDSADETTRELFEIAQSLDDPDLLLQAHHAAWPIPMLRGAFAPSYKHIEQGLRLYDYERHKQHAFVYMGHDPAVCAHALGAVVAWHLGYLEQACRHADDALHLARRLGHPPSLALALWFIGGAYAARGDSADALATADELLRLSEEQKLVQTRASALVIGGWALAREGQADEGLNRLRAGLAVWHRMGARHYLPPFTCLLAESLMCAQRYEEALPQIDQALAYCEETGERWWQARIYQTRGQLLYCRKSRSDKCAVDCFRTAIEIARSQCARALELRAATNLARLLSERDQQREAYDTLASVYGWFTEGFDTPDLMAAKALLEELS